MNPTLKGFDFAHSAIKVRLHLLLLCVGWGGPIENFVREGQGWRLGNGVLTTPWDGREPPWDPLTALEQAEAFYREDITMLLDYFRNRFAPEVTHG